MVRYLPLLRSLLDTFSAICFTLLAVLCLRDRGRPQSHWGSTVYLWTAVVCAIHFLYRSGRALFAEPLANGLGVLDTCALFVLPALLFHLIYRSERPHAQWRVVWSASALVLYLLGAAGIVVKLVGAVELAEPLRGFSVALLGGAALLAILLALAPRSAPVASSERRQRRWLFGLCALLTVVSIARLFAEPLWLMTVQDAVPLGFVFVVTYWVERFTFFDVLIKKGALAFSALVVVTAYFVWVTPLLRKWNAGFTYPLTFWPIVLAYPWFNRRMCAWLDQVCLGRKFSPAGASNHFLSGLQGSVSAEELARRAERLLAEIFQAEAEVTLGSEGGVAIEAGVETVRVPVGLGGQRIAWICLRKPESRTRFLSEDLALLASLADSLAFLLENLRLRDKRLEQEKRVKELELNANRLELKALRAQVNPHFLFNALNTIAGLIPRFPARAQTTIEQLAQVFRFTLRRMDREWVRLEEEMEAVRAYLDVEQARFGNRLQFRIQMSEEAGRTRIPAMIVQTLVENAVKHGISVQSAPGLIEITVSTTDERICVEVRDTGPGFPPSADRVSPEGGHGLPNIRDRLRGYFGEDAELRTGRDAARAMTVVAVDLPHACVAMEAAVP
jgi:signal transduction histidine kinase